MSDPNIALVEIVANCWDAGADRVDITWPDTFPGPIAVKDNGTGMTHQEFTKRWLQFSYNRRDEQGEYVEFPRDNQSSMRKAFGRNGKGRHGMFCFANEYVVETWKNDTIYEFRVARVEDNRMPFQIELSNQSPRDGHGTVISTTLVWNYLSIQNVRDLLGSKFVADPSFRIYVNNEPVELTDLEHLSDVHELQIGDLGQVVVRHFDSQKTGRTSKQHGVAWWVNKRLVGEPSWRGFDDSVYLDARKSEAKRHTFVIEADLLADQVEADWSGFKESERFDTVNSYVKDYILAQLHQLLRDIHKTRKVEALEVNRQGLKELSTSSRYHVGNFVDEIQVACPSIGQKELTATVKVLSKMEKSRTGFTLLEQLAKLDPNDLDSLSRLLNTWTMQEAMTVLDELEKRLKLIESLENLVEDPSADELHDIQPLFECGLWIFGPEYESVSFMSNRSLATIVKEFFQDQGVILSTPRRRPDFVALPDASIGIYSSDDHDDGEVSGIAKVLLSVS